MGRHMDLVAMMRWKMTHMMGVIAQRGRSCINVLLLSPHGFMRSIQSLLLMSWMEALLNMMHKGLRKLRGSTTRRILQLLIIMSSSMVINDANNSVLANIMCVHGRRLQKFGEFSFVFILVALVPQFAFVLAGLRHWDLVAWRVCSCGCLCSGICSLMESQEKEGEV